MEDNSILSRLFFSRYFDWVVTFVPRNVSPNLLTFIGGLSMVLSCLLTIVLDTSLSSPKSSFLHLFNAICLFFYFTMDSIDGKQAIRISETSPLGQIIDHGIDSLVSTLGTIPIASSLGVGTGLNLMMLITCVYIQFYCVTLYEKFTSKVVFGYLTSPAECVSICVLIHLIAFFKSPSFFSDLSQTSISSRIGANIPNISLFLMFFLLFYVTYFLMNILHKTQVKFAFLIIKNLGIIITLLSSANLVANYVVPRNIFFNYAIVFIIMFLCSYMIVDLIFSRLKNTNIPTPPDPYFLFLFHCLFYLYKPNIMFLESYLSCLLVLMLISYSIRMFSIIVVISRFLNINVLHCNKKV